MKRHISTTFRTRVLFSLMVSLLLFAVTAATAVAQPRPHINYQGKLTDATGVAVANGSYNMRFWLLQSTSQATSSAIWTEERLVGSSEGVQVTDGLFSVMLGSTSPLTGVDFNQPLYLGVEIGSTGGSPSWDGEMLPRKPLGTVPAAFESYRLGGVSSSSFLRADTDDIASGLVTFTGGLISSASSSLANVTMGNATATELHITSAVGIGTTTPDRELVVDGDVQITGGLYDNVNSSGAAGQILQSTNGGFQWVSTTSLNIATTADDLSDNSIQDLSDVASITENYGDLFYWNGSAWADIATSSLGLGDGSFLGLSDTPGSYTTNAIPYVSGSALAFDSTFVYDGTGLGIGTASPGAMLDIYGVSNALRLSYDGSNYSELSVNASGNLNISSTGGTGSTIVLGTGLAEDLMTLFDGNAADWYTGLDDTDDFFKIGTGSTVGTNTLLQLSSASTTIFNALYASTTATSTFGGGIKLEGGCFQDATGSCIKSAGDTSVVVAASDSPANEKAFADYVADGTNDEVEIQQAIDYVYANGGGGTVHLLAGTFTVGTTTYTDRAINMATSTRLVGQGEATVIKLRDGFNANVSVVKGENVQDTYLGHVAVDGNRYSQTAAIYYGVNFSNTSSSTVEHAYVHNVQDYGVYMYNVSDSSVAKNVIYNNPYGIYTINYSDNNLFSENIVRESSQTGIYLRTYSDSNLITNNIVQGAGYGIHIYFYSDNNVVSSNRIENTDYGIYLQNSVDNSVVSTNIVNNNSIFGIVLFEGTENTIVSDNHLSGNSFSGSYASLYVGDGARDVLVSSNFISATSSHELIEITSNVERTTVIGNTYINPDTTTYVSDAGTDTRYNEWDRTTITTDNTRGYNLFSIIGSTTATSAAITQLGTGDILTLDNASGRQLTVTNSGYLGLGTSSPSSRLSVAGNTWLDSNVITFASTSASSLLLRYMAAATSSIIDNSTFAFTIATSTSASPIFRIDTNGTPSTYLTGNFNVNNGALSYNASTNQTTIENLSLGNMQFADDAGAVTWADMGITASSATGTVNSYTAYLDANPLLTIYGESSGYLGNLQNGAVGIGTTSPWARLSVVGDNTDPTKPLFAIASSTGSTTFLVGADGSITMNYLGGGLLTTDANGLLATTTIASSSLAATGWASGYVLQASTTAEGGFAWVSTTTLGFVVSADDLSDNNLTDLSDVDTTNAAYGDILSYNGASWATTSTSSLGLGDGSLEGLSDVSSMTETYGDLFYWNGSAWADIATSSLGLGDGSFLGLSDTPGSYTTNAIPYVSGSALAFDSTFVYDGTNLGLGTASPGAMLDIYGTSNRLRLSYDGSNYTELWSDASGDLTISSTGGTASVLTLGAGAAEDTAFIYDGNALDYYLGLDDTDDTFKLGLGSTVGTDSLLELTKSTTTVTNILYVSTTTATSTFANGIKLEGGCFQDATGSCIKSAGDTQVVVAASDSPAAEKAYADYVADGTNDEVEIQQAIDYVYANGGGGTVHLLAGTYTVGVATADNDSIVLATSTRLVGQGPATIIKLADSTNSNLQIIAARGAASAMVHDVAIDNLTIDVNRDNQTPSTYNQAGVYFSYVASSTLNGVRVQGSWGDGVRVASSDRVTITNSSLLYADSRGIRLNSTSNTYIAGNYFANTTWSGVRLESFSDNNVITGNRFINSGSDGGVRIVSGDDNIISSNIISGTTNGHTIDATAVNTVLVGNVYAENQTVADSGTNTRYNEWDRTTLTTDTTRGYDLFSITGSTTAVSAAITQLGTGDILTLDNASGRVLTVTNSGYLGLGTSSPSARLSVAGNTWLDSNVITFASTSASSLLLRYMAAATSSIIDNSTFAFTIATSTSASPIFRIDTNGTPSTYLTGNFNVNNGALSYDASTNQTTIENLSLGNMQFADDGGIVSWANMNVTASSSAGAVLSYTANLDSVPLLTIYGVSDGAGGVSSTSVGIGTTSPNARLSLQHTGFSGNGVIGFDQFLQTVNNVEDAIQYGDRFYLDASSTAATTTIVGSMLRLEDNSIYGNTIRGLEVQANKGINTNGENTALSGSARTFGVRGITTGDAGGDFEPAGGYFETRGTTQGNAIRGYSNDITTATLLSLFQDTSDFQGTGLEMNFGNGGGGAKFSSTTSKYLDFQNAGVSVFTVSAFGTTTIGRNDLNTDHQAGLQIPYGGLCVDNDGQCNASTTGRISAINYHTGDSDLAEMYFSATELETGEVVMLAGGLSIDRALPGTSTPVLGVISTKPGMTLGADDASLEEGEQGYPVALTGRVPVKLSTENGPIKRGDQLMLSSLPGVAMKAVGAGTIIGVALEDFDDTRMYSDTYVNQFGDDLIHPVYEPINSELDPRINDGCYYGGGVETGEAPCVPLVATSTDEQIEEANDYIEQQEVTRLLEEMRETESETVTLDEDTEVQVGQIVMFVDLSYRWIDDTQLATINALMGTSSITAVGDNEEETIFDRLVALANRFVDGVLSVLTLKADRVEVAEELCVEGVCVTADDLRILLDVQAATAVGSSNTSAGSNTNTSGGNEPSDEPEPTPEPEPIDTASSTDDTASTTDQTSDPEPEVTETGGTDGEVTEVTEEGESVTEPAEETVEEPAETTTEEPEVAEESAPEPEVVETPEPEPTPEPTSTPAPEPSSDVTSE